MGWSARAVLIGTLATLGLWVGSGAAHAAPAIAEFAVGSCRRLRMEARIAGSDTL